MNTVIKRLFGQINHEAIIFCIKKIYIIAIFTLTLRGELKYSRVNRGSDCKQSSINDSNLSVCNFTLQS